VAGRARSDAGRPEEIALPILFLVSAGSFLSGETIYVGGATCQML
jgi:NAD(P)-dependent dehydrogenase (short-subunit alcohol dehydrogenase family)